MIKIDDLAQLMNIAAKGDKQAFERIVQLMSPKLIKIVRYYTNQSPEDVMQEIWLKIWEKVSVLADKEHPEYWFYTVVRYHCYDEGRRSKSQKRNADVVSMQNESVRDYLEMVRGATADYTNPENLLITKETAEFVRRNMDRLSDIYALPLYLYYFNDMSLLEIGQILKLPASTIKWRLYTGRQLLKKEISKYDY